MSKQIQRKRTGAQRAGDWAKKFIQICALLLSYAGRGLAALAKGAGKILARPGRWMARVLRDTAALPGKARGVLTERRDSRFPESDYGLVQRLLFVRGMMPRLGGMISEGLLRRRKQSAQDTGRIRGRLEALRIHPAVFLICSMAVAAAAVALSLYTVGTAVSYDGKELCVVAGGGEVERAVSWVEEITRQTLHTPGYKVDEERIEARRKLVNRKNVASQEALRDALTEQIGLIDYGCVLYVDGEAVAATPYSGALEELLSQLKAGYVTENTVECSFVETTDIRQEYVDRSSIKNLGYIAELVNDTKQGEVNYTVVAGDTYYGIAEKYGLTLAQLLDMNPGYDVNMLHVGDVLTVSRAVPYLTVVDVERQSAVMDVPYQVTYQDDPNMYQGDCRVLSPGQSGKEDVTSNVTYVNGEERGRQVVARATLVQPVTEIQARGTKERPYWLATGYFRWPCSGVLTSRFGYRPIPIAGASPYHKGIDIGNSYGTPICASDGGTVEYAGWRSGYGYLVIIDHGNGYKTYYGHNSSLLAHTGDHVYPGQQIARMGSTGMSTGNHCHFGIMLNDTFVNPLNYLR